MSERLAVDVTVTREAKILGKKWDDRDPVTGQRITRVEFTKSVEGLIGKGDAFPSDVDLPDVAVHAWLDLQSKLTYTLRVWVED